MSQLTCGNCYYYRPQTYVDKNDIEIAYTIGICLCHGYHLKSTEEICVDFNR